MRRYGQAAVKPLSGPRSISDGRDMSFFRKLKDRLLKSSSKIDEGVEALLEEGDVVEEVAFDDKKLKWTGDARQALLDDVLAEVLQVQVDVIIVGADAAALAYLYGHRAAHHVAAR